MMEHRYRLLLESVEKTDKNLDQYVMEAVEKNISDAVKYEIPSFLRKGPIEETKVFVGLNSKGGMEVSIYFRMKHSPVHEEKVRDSFRRIFTNELFEPVNKFGLKNFILDIREEL